MSLWWWTTVDVSEMKPKIQHISGLEYLYSHIAPDQLDLPDFVLKHDMEVSNYHGCFNFFTLPMNM